MRLAVPPIDSATRPTPPASRPPMVEHGSAPTIAARTRTFERQPTLATTVGLAFTAVAFLVAARALSDNSFLTHLATGHLILDGHFPHTDPFSFSAHGSPWVVQSWIPAVVYATADKIAGGAGIRFVCGAIAAALMVLVWRLTRGARTLLPRVVIAGLTLVVGAGLWASRPYMFGLLFLATTLVIIREQRRPFWLVPIFWLWVNCHGSWPLGLVLLAVWLVGSRADHEPTKHPWRALKWALGGTALGAVGPLGLSALTFPVELLTRTKVLSMVVEWQAPTFTALDQRAFLAAVVIAIVCLTRRPSYRNAFITAVFAAAALVGSRNIVVASLVLVPVLADGLAGLGSIDGHRRSRAIRVGACAGLAVAVAAGVGLLRNPSWDFSDYPVAATAYLQQHGLIGPGHRVIARDVVGNYWEYRFGTKANVFFDDRFDMYSDELDRQNADLISVRPGWRKVIAQWHPDAILWDATSPLTDLLKASGDWHVAYHDKAWVVLVPQS